MCTRPTCSGGFESASPTATASPSPTSLGRSVTGGGDAKKLRHAGIPTVEFALGTDTLHAPDEYVPVDALVDNAVAYAQIPAAWRAETDR